MPSYKVFVGGVNILGPDTISLKLTGDQPQAPTDNTNSNDQGRKQWQTSKGARARRMERRFAAQLQYHEEKMQKMREQRTMEMEDLEAEHQPESPSRSWAKESCRIQYDRARRTRHTARI